MLPKTGKVLPTGNGASRDIEHDPDAGYAMAIAEALQTELGGSHQATKTVMRWTGASERTVKNWFRGTCGPSGEHLITLVQNSDMVFEAFLRLSSRHQSLASKKLVEARNAIAEVLEIVVGLTV
jgi:hypothetical protein